MLYLFRCVVDCQFGPLSAHRVAVAVIVWLNENVLYQQNERMMYVIK